jgi:hypothetical protein
VLSPTGSQEEQAKVERDFGKLRQQQTGRGGLLNLSQQRSCRPLQIASPVVRAGPTRVADAQRSVRAIFGAVAVHQEAARPAGRPLEATGASRGSDKARSRFPGRYPAIAGIVAEMKAQASELPPPRQ